MNTMKWAEEIYETPSEWGETYYWDKKRVEKNIRMLWETQGEGWEDIGIDDCVIYSLLTSATPGIEEELGDDEKLYEQYHRGGIRYFVFTHASDQGEYRFLREVCV